jgi:peptidoglycan/xylan/chitin deacetylase (PgdA/CDA1 family)
MDFFNTTRGVRLVDATLPALVDQLKRLNENISTPKKYQYATLPMEDVASAVQVLTNPDAYISEDATTAALRDLLAQGYRWVRNDEYWAIFEKETL